jgi:hypothetical protein
MSACGGWSGAGERVQPSQASKTDEVRVGRVHDGIVSRATAAICPSVTRLPAQVNTCLAPTQRPTTDECSPVEIRAITLLRFGKSAKKRLQDSQVPTLSQASLWLAQIGGYTGKSSGGPPGSVTLTRGLKEVAAVVRAFDAWEANCD